ncbi:13079_t:CDS:2, partial [Dentiscutata heterogama]
WIPYENFKKIEYLNEGGFGKVYSAIWTDGRILEWNDRTQQWKRKGKMNVALKILHNSYAKFDEFLQEQLIVRCWDRSPVNRPNADELFTTFYNWWKEKDSKDSELYKQIQKSKKFTKINPR